MSLQDDVAAAFDRAVRQRARSRTDTCNVDADVIDGDGAELASNLSDLRDQLLQIAAEIDHELEILDTGRRII